MLEEMLERCRGPATTTRRKVSCYDKAAVYPFMVVAGALMVISGEFLIHGRLKRQVLPLPLCSCCASQSPAGETAAELQRVRVARRALIDG